MADFPGAWRLSAPRLSDVRLHTLLDSLDDSDCRIVLSRFLVDPWPVQGSAEYYAHDLHVPLDLADVPRHLVTLRHAGWLHQRPASLGLASRLRRDDLDLRFPDTMRSLRVPLRIVGGSGGVEIEARLRRLSA